MRVLKRWACSFWVLGKSRVLVVWSLDPISQAFYCLVRPGGKANVPANVPLSNHVSTMSQSWRALLFVCYQEATSMSWLQSIEVTSSISSNLSSIVQSSELIQRHCHIQTQAIHKWFSPQAPFQVWIELSRIGNLYVLLFRRHFLRLDWSFFNDMTNFSRFNWTPWDHFVCILSSVRTLVVTQ